MMLKLVRGALVEYGLAVPPMALVFELNPQSITRTRTIQVRTGRAAATRGGYDFLLPSETPRAAQGVTAAPETLGVDVLFDATDRMSRGDVVAELRGVQPELDTLRTMIEPKSQMPGGAQVLASLGGGLRRAFQRDQSPSVLLLVWGNHVLPVFLTSLRIEETAHLPTLLPYRATATLSMQVIEGNNPFYLAEKGRQVLSAALNLGRLTAEALGRTS